LLLAGLSFVTASLLADHLIVCYWLDRMSGGSLDSCLVGGAQWLIKLVNFFLTLTF